MRNNKTTQEYFSTSQAAKLLGLSVGTIQRMVENGVFKAFVTQGGHRRILSSSFSQYCKQQGFKTPQTATDKPLVCILHSSEDLTPALNLLKEWPQVKVMTHPLDLMNIHQNVGVFFIDARIPWLHSSPLHLQDDAIQNAHIVVYNSHDLPTTSALHLAKAISLFENDISTDLVYGYMLGLDHAQEAVSLKSPASKGTH
ncbi:helix-turn-helix domain-containing protein [Limnohabitans sp. DM1]|uniref:helix-turn-helix domain-containing protein n=1 Tax=Limnohabitans sp. DM1 TaxID=1597955 RepID=UPI000ACF2DCA|nr:helix-turn-helix domain-containing protein [Limnohabitans sp. DM1]